MAIYALIGGRSISNHMNSKIEKMVLEYLNIKNPKILFFPFACLDDMEKSCDKFLNLMKDVECDIECVYDLNDSSLMNKIKECDCLYFGGGHSEDLIKCIKESCVYDFLISDNQKLICGVSAGAILISKSGMGDRYAYSNNN